MEGLEVRSLLTAGPEMLVDLNPGGYSWATEFTAVGDTVYFSNNGADLWKTDGTPANTVKVKTFADPSLNLSEWVRIIDFTDAGGVLAFIAFDDNDTWDDSSDDRVQLWKSNGTETGTVLVKDFGLQSTVGGPEGSSYLTAVGGSVFAVLRTGVGDATDTGNELFVSDLDESDSFGTQLVKDIHSGESSSDPSDLLAFGGKLYFAANDGQHGTELWVSDGTADHTQLVKDIKDAGDDLGSYLTDLTAGNGEFFFGILSAGPDGDPATPDDNRVELWKSAGAESDTVLIQAFAPGTSLPSALDDDLQLTYVLETGKLFGVVEFVDGGGRSQDLVCWDGTTMHHWNLNPGGDDQAGNLSPSFGLLGFGADNGTDGREPWLSDGNSANSGGTFMIKDIAPGDESGLDLFQVGAAPFPAVNTLVYFPANDGVTGTELWRSDGTEEGTALVADIRPGSGLYAPYSSYPYDLTAAFGKLFFVADDGVHDYDPWVYSPAGDIQVQEATADGTMSLQVTYQIVGDAAPAFELGFFVSSDPFLDAGDTPVASATIGDPADRSVGSHTKSLAIGTGPGEIALPGAGVLETDGEYYILAVADPENLVEETDADPVQEDNTASLIGVYHPPAGDVFVHGTQDADQIAVSSGSLELVVNGIPLSYDLATTAGVRVRGHGGDDHASFDAGGGFAVAPPLQLFVHGGAGNNGLTLRDSAGDDVLTMYPARATMSGPGYFLRSEATGQIYAYATAGGDDEARLYDSAGDDTFAADGQANGVRLQGPDGDNYAEGFDRTYAYAAGGGADTARLYDSAGDDLFQADGKANGVRLQGSGIDLYAEQFEKTYAYATGGGADTAKLYDSAGDDLFQADGQANGVRLEGSGIDLYAEGFEQTYAYATGGGIDTAKLYDSTDNDLFQADGKANGVRLQGGGIDLYAEQFEKTYGYATAGGDDTAKLYDSAGDDTFTTDGAANGARLQGGGIDLYAEGFEQTYAYATGGGVDTATMYDSAGDDTFTFDHPGGRFQGVGFDAYAEGFDGYSVYATRGGYDRSYLYDTDGNDALTGQDNWYELTTPYEQVRGEGFDYVQATKNKTGTDTLNVLAVDYVFEELGDWQ